MLATYQPVPDPFPGKGPIPASAPGDFYERGDILTNVLNLLRAGDSVSLVGERKAGKTSFLNHLLTHLPTDEFIPVLIDAQRIAPRKDKMFLGQLIRKAAEKIAEVNNLGEPINTNTLTAQPDEVYNTFQNDLDFLRSKITPPENNQKRRLVWLIDEIETLRGYDKTELFSFLRPLAQSDPDFRMVVAGYDVLYTLSNLSEWSPFFNAFGHIRVEGLNTVIARQLIDDALQEIGITIEADLYQQVFTWSGRKPFYLKWLLSVIVVKVLNAEKVDYHINTNILDKAKGLFLDEHDVNLQFSHLWGTHTTQRQQTVLSLIAPESGPYNYLKILEDLKDKKLVENDQQAKQHLIDDLTRLQQLGFLYDQAGEYTFTSDCLKAWITKNKPLG